VLGGCMMFRETTERMARNRKAKKVFARLGLVRLRQAPMLLMPTEQPLTRVAIPAHERRPDVPYVDGVEWSPILAGLESDLSPKNCELPRN
jgi:hypothetical protein